MADATELGQCGGKAVGLALLARAGLPVPPAVVVTYAAFLDIVQPGPEPAGPAPVMPGLPAAPSSAEISAVHAWATYWSELAQHLAHVDIAPALLRDLVAHAAAWHQVAVRSSMAVEDSARAAAPGLFVSQNNVATTATAIADALRAVWTSACTPMVADYRARRAAGAGGFAIAAIVQRFVAGERLVIYTRPPGAATEPTALVQQGGTTRRLARNATNEPALQLALAAESAINATQGADVELVQQLEGTLWIVQARPIVHPRTNDRRPAPPTSLLAGMHADGRTWTFDYTHNPTPLSIAQAELVQAVQAAGVAPFALRLCAGYLYATPVPRSSAESADLPDGVLENASNLAAYWATLCARMAATLASDDASLSAVLQRYVAFYDLWANRVAPLIKAARRRLQDEFAAQGTPLEQQREMLRQIARPSSIDRQLQRCANGEIDDNELRARIAEVATQWDVASPTYGEHWDSIRQAVARLRTARAGLPPVALTMAAPALVARDDPQQLAALQSALAIARLGADYAEQDDLWFFRAQAAVRRALLQRAAQLGLADDRTDDIFWLPWSMLRDDAHFDSVHAHAQARAARAAAQRATMWQMPLHIGAPLESPPSTATAVGGGGRFEGIVWRIEPETLAQRSPAMAGDGAVVVIARALTPGLALGLAGATGIVCDAGGFLDHGAAMARELGVPYLVGTHDVFDRCYDGQRIAVDPDTGTVTLYP